MYFEIILGVDEAALEFSSLVGVWSVRVDEGNYIRKLPELNQQQTFRQLSSWKIAENKKMKGSLIWLNHFNLSNLEVHIEESTNEDPELVVVESSEGSNELEKGLKVKSSLSVVQSIVQTSPGADSQSRAAWFYIYQK